MKRRLLTPGLAILTGMMLGPASLSAQKVAAEKKSPKEVEVRAAMDVKNVPSVMEATRRDFQQLLQLHPRLLGVFYHDPSLLADPDYVKKNAPDLAAFLEQHPEAVQNPEYFLGSEVQQMHDFELRSRRPAEYNATMRMMDLIGPFVIFVIIVGVLVWILKFLVENRRWNRIAKIQQEVHTKLMDKFSSSQDLQAYMQTEAGKRFLESAPIPIEPEQKSRISVPLGRILWSIQAGVILAMGSLGLILARSYVPEAAPPLTVFGTLGLMLGLGFLLAAGASYGLSRHLGLFESPTSGPAA